MSEQGQPPGGVGDGDQRRDRAPQDPLRDDEPAIADAVEELGGSGEVTPGDDNFPEAGRGRASEPGKPLRSP